MQNFAHHEMAAETMKYIETKKIIKLKQR